jgi:hypothetical protein
MTHRNFLIEIWTELAIGAVIVFIRLCARLKAVRIRSLRVDDYLMVVLLVSLK